jgi:SHS2 domain-containing protein
VTSSYWQIDHTGDIGIEAEAGDENGLFACCAEALFDILAEPISPAAPAERIVEVSAPDRETLLVRWLRELLYLHEVDRWIFNAFEVETARRPEGERRLRGVARGEIYDPARHLLRTELKAVTYHQIRFRKESEGLWRARVIFDV